MSRLVLIFFLLTSLASANERIFQDISGKTFGVKKPNWVDVSGKPLKKNPWLSFGRIHLEVTLAELRDLAEIISRAQQASLSLGEGEVVMVDSFLSGSGGLVVVIAHQSRISLSLFQRQDSEVFFFDVAQYDALDGVLGEFLVSI